MAKQNAAEFVTRYERDIDARRVGEVLERMATGAPATLDVANCLRACGVKAVDTLPLRDGAMVHGVVCDSCGRLGLAGDECPVSGDRTRSTEDILDELAQEVIDQSGSVRHVEADTELEEHPAAALLRFPLPPLP
ncbi:hypothetical protein [Nocardia abscessus]|uniref:hypothetical protein n=1 Tax=Nocardia abscessus TaxID=120957 RepID=UPI002454B8BE|nr:hypothetical protein [Nocardia abscessus]